MENNNGNGRGIFYGVIGVATLIVAIIGATFAYFSATANSADNAIMTASTEVKLGLDVLSTGYKSDLIPVNAGDTNFKYYAGSAVDDCKDNDGNNICSVYSFIVYNESTTALQTAYGYFLPEVVAPTKAFNNLYFATYRGFDADVIAASTANENVQNQYDVGAVTWSANASEAAGTWSDGNAGAAVTLPGTVNTTYDVVGRAGDLLVSARNASSSKADALTIGKTGFAITSQKLAPNTTEGTKECSVLDATGEPITSAENCTTAGGRWVSPNSYAAFTMVLWVQEVNGDQTPGDSGCDFSGQIYFTTAGAGNGVTGNIGATGRTSDRTSRVGA